MGIQRNRRHHLPHNSVRSVSLLRISCRWALVENRTGGKQANGKATNNCATAKEHQWVFSFGVF